MNISDKIPHGKIGHMCKGGCVGYAKGGVVSQDALDLADIAASGVPLAADPEMMQAALDAAKRPSRDANDLADLAATDVPIAADPEMMQAALDAAKGQPSQDALDLSDIAASGVPIAADPQMIDAGLRALMGKGEVQGVPGYAEGGVVDKSGDSGDNVDIPEDVKEYIEKLHVKRQESRPDETWRMVGEKPAAQEIPYKRDQEQEEAAEEKTMEGEELPGYAEGGIVDPNDLLGQIAPVGTGMIAPSPASQPAPAAPMPAAPAAPAPIVSRETMPAGPQPTDADFVQKANKLLGLDPNQQAGFMKMLGDRSQKAQLGAGLAGIGDAIASGGTLGKVNPGALNKAEDLISNRENAGISGMQTIRGNQEKAIELGDKLQARDPNSPLSKYAQKAYASVGKKIGIDLSHASAALIADVTGKGVEALNTELQNQLKGMQVDLQRKTLDATMANQKSEQEIARQGRSLEADKALAARGPLDKVFGLLPGTASHDSKKRLEEIASQASFAPDVISYAQKHGITAAEAQAIKDKRTKG